MRRIGSIVGVVVAVQPRQHPVIIFLRRVPLAGQDRRLVVDRVRDHRLDVGFVGFRIAGIVRAGSRDGAAILFEVREDPFHFASSRQTGSPRSASSAPDRNPVITVSISLGVERRSYGRRRLFDKAAPGQWHCGETGDDRRLEESRRPQRKLTRTPSEAQRGQNDQAKPHRPSRRRCATWAPDAAAVRYRDLLLTS